jgi:hypothetical protein
MNLDITAIGDCFAKVSGPDLPTGAIGIAFGRFLRWEQIYQPG